MHPQHGLGDAQLVLARRAVVVDERARQRRFAVVARGERDLRFTVVVAGRRATGDEGVQVGLQGLRPVPHLLEHLARQAQHGAPGDGLRRELPDPVAADQRAFAEVVAVGHRAEHRLVAVGAGADLGDLAVRDEEDVVGLAAELDERVTRLVLVLAEAARQLVEDLFVVVPAQRCRLAELRRDHADLGAGRGERDPPVAHGVAQPAVDAVGAAGDLDPRQQLQQPPRRDALHLRDGLRRRRQGPGRGPAEAQRCLFRGRGVHRVGDSHSENHPFVRSRCAPALRRAEL